MSLSNNVVPTAGRNLIAAASAADQIILVEFRASETAYTALQLESAVPSDFEVTGGIIRNTSVSDTVARITGALSNQLSAKTCKSFAVLARLSSQSAGSEVVLVAGSDSAANIRVPSTSEPPVLISVPLSITTAESGSVAIVSGSAAAPSDLDAYMTIYDPADHTQGQNQNIMGQKVFENYTYFLSSVDIDGEVHCNDYLEAYAFSSYDILAKDVYGSYQEYAPSPQLDLHGQDNQGGFTGAHIEFLKNTDDNGYDYNYIQARCTAQGQYQYPVVRFRPRFAFGGDTLPSCVELESVDTLKPETDNTVDIGTSGLKFKDIYAYKFRGTLKGNLDGCIPIPEYTSGTTQNVPVGALVLLWANYTGKIELGDIWETFTPSNLYRIACFNHSTGQFTYSSKQLGSGTYQSLSETDSAPNGGMGLILAIRIS